MNKIKTIALILAGGFTPVFAVPQKVSIDEVSVDILASTGEAYMYPMHTVQRIKIIRFTDEEQAQFEEDEAVNKLLDLEELDALEDEAES